MSSIESKNSETGASKEQIEKFNGLVKEAAEKFKLIDKSETIRFVSHLDADGLSSAAIIVKTMLRENRKYCLSIVPQLTEEIAMQLATENYNYYVFSDLGTGQFDVLKKHLGGKKVFILDHHHIQGETEAENFVHVNPHLIGIESSTAVSGSGVSYLFAKALNEKNKDLSHLALVGAIGDMQEDNGFTGLNAGILEDAKQVGMIKTIKGLRLFGAQTKPLHTILERSSEFSIPGVSGSESGSIQFLQQLGVSPKNEDGSWRKLTDLNDDELVKLATGVVMQRIGEKNPEGIIGPVYILTNEADGSPLRDAREFATLLNACGRLEKASVGIGACLNDTRCKEGALTLLTEYKKQISNSIKWYEQTLKQKDMEAKTTTGEVVLENGFVIINAEDNILPTMIGTLASMISRSENIQPGTFILSMARAKDDYTKVSLRLTGKWGDSKINLMEIMTDVAGKVGGQAGGHNEAAGALIKTDKETELIELAKRAFKEKNMEEKVTL
jgi:single-stranded-DNA-specific exonuclease